MIYSLEKSKIRFIMYRRKLLHRIGMSEGAITGIAIIIRNGNKMNNKKVTKRIREGVQNSQAEKNAALCYSTSACRQVDESLYTALKAK
jgi:hypothetical protein